MPRPLDHSPDNADKHYSIQVNKDDLRNDSQYNDAVSWICGRMLRPFGLQHFMLIAVRWMAQGLKRDGRKATSKALEEAETRLLQAAFDYDRALSDAKEAEAPKRRVGAA